jgi:hypothetical protein
VERQKALSLPGGFESAHLSFSHPSGLMRNLGPIVGILLGIVGDTRQDRSTGSSIALQLVGDDPEWFLALTAQQSAKNRSAGHCKVEGNLYDFQARSTNVKTANQQVSSSPGR